MIFIYANYVLDKNTCKELEFLFKNLDKLAVDDFLIKNSDQIKDINNVLPFYAIPEINNKNESFYLIFLTKKKKKFFYFINFLYCK